MSNMIGENNSAFDSVSVHPTQLVTLDTVVRGRASERLSQKVHWSRSLALVKVER